MVTRPQSNSASLDSIINRDEDEEDTLIRRVSLAMLEGLTLSYS